LVSTGSEAVDKQAPVAVTEGEELAGHLRLFDEALVGALNVAAHLLQSPESLAWLLEAAGAVALERCGAIIAERTAAAG
jgi:hypothetical protein